MSTLPFVGVVISLYEKNVNINKHLIIGHCYYTTTSVVCGSYLGYMKYVQAFGSVSTLCSVIISACTYAFPNVCYGVAAHLGAEIQLYKLCDFQNAHFV
jgi:hypothetical protein